MHAQVAELLRNHGELALGYITQVRPLTATPFLWQTFCGISRDTKMCAGQLCVRLQ